MWNTWWRCTILMMMWWTSCGQNDRAPFRKPSPCHLKRTDSVPLVDPLQALADRVKFCNPDYEYGPNETPVIVACPVFHSPQRDTNFI